jgi:glycosyltransferase involved in cell wall biosynthesis
MSKERLRIAHIIPVLDGLGGAEPLVIEMANEAAYQGHEVVVYSLFKLRRDIPVTERNKLSSDVRRIDVLDNEYDRESNRFQRIVLPLLRTTVWVLVNRKSLLNYDVIHAHLSFASFLTAILWKVKGFRRRNRPIFVETVHFDFIQRSPKQLRNFHKWWHCRDGVILEGLNGDEYLFRNRIPHVLAKHIPIGVVPVRMNQVTYEQEEEFRRFIAIPAGTRVMLVIQRYEFLDKRIDLFPQLAKRLKEQATKPFVILLFGGGADGEKLCALIDELGVQDVCQMKGFLKEMGPAFKVADLMISVRHGNTTGLAGIQGAFAGVPGVAIQGNEGYGDLNEWMPNSSDLEELASYILRLLEDSEGQQNLAKKQREYVSKNHLLEIMTKETIKFYDEVFEFVESKSRN